MDNLSVADTGTTGHYLTLDSPCDNKQQAVHLLPNVQQGLIEPWKNMLSLYLKRQVWVRQELFARYQQ